jgi:hypothetical protein
MAIPVNHSCRYIFHFTDIHNLDSIIKKGLLCTNVKNKMGIKHKNIANMTIQERRANMKVPVGPGGKVHDYVPFYFSSMNPMLLMKLNEKNVDQQFIIYFCIKIQRLEKDDAVFTDASANTNEPPTFYDNVNDLDKLDWQAIDKKSWGAVSDEERHKKMAEALIHKRVDIGEIDAILVFNDSIKEAVKKVFEENRIKSPAIILDGDARVKNYHFYYTKFFLKDQSMKNDSLVTGPLTLLHEYKGLIEIIRKERSRKRANYPYRTVSDIVQAIEGDFTVIQELKSVTGLLQDYPPHTDTVDNHTKKVVEELKKQDYYKNSSTEKKNILLFASYLHDMGKGPKTKWENEKMTRAYPDHPADAIPMLKRILVEEVENLTDEEIRLVCMLVVYHDIIGDCMEKGRDKQQVVDVIENEDDLEMLFSISCADAKAINGAWALGIFGRKKSFAEAIMKMKKQ